MRKSVRRATVVLALTPVVSIPMALAYADGTGLTPTGTTAVSTPAPSGDASAVAAEVSGVITVGKTQAHAGSDGGTADATALSVLGQQVAGGSQKGVGSKGGNLIGTGNTPVGDAELAPWSTKVTDAGGGTQSAAEAALAHAKVNNVAEAWVLHSQSTATWTPDASTGDAQSDGAEVSALGLLDIKVLHAEAHSTGKGKSDLLVINGNEIGSSSDANGACSLSIPSILDLLCLTASGGPGAGGITSAAASVATFSVGGGALTGTVSGASASGSTGATATPGTPKPGTPTPSQGASGGNLSGGAHTPDQVPAVQQRGSLPFTGMDAIRAALAALAMTVSGGAFMLAGRRRRGAITA